MKKTLDDANLELSRRFMKDGEITQEDILDVFGFNQELEWIYQNETVKEYEFLLPDDSDCERYSFIVKTIEDIIPSERRVYETGDWWVFNAIRVMATEKEAKKLLFLIGAEPRTIYL